MTMALDYRKCAQEIVDHIGGRENVAQAAHCATRLRLVIKDNSKVDKEYLDNVEGVKGMFESNGQLQLIIGTGTVNKVYDEFLAITGMSAATKDDVKAAAAARQPLWKRLLKPIGDVFVPILPAIVASGLMMGLVEALGKASPSFASTDWYAFLDLVANTAFVFLPVIIAVSAARVFGGNIFLGAVIGCLMIHPALTNGWNAANGYDVWYLFGQIRIGNYTLGQINQLGYQGHVIPVMLSVLLMSKVEKWLHAHVPEMIDLFVTPLTTVFVTALATFAIIGPIFSTLETIVLDGAKILVQNPIGSCLMGALYPVTVVMGLHHMYNVIEAGMLAVKPVGGNIWMPIASAANFAQFGACLAVALKSQKDKTKSIALPSSLSAALGITEPAIFGINLRFYKPFVGGMIGGAIGALLASFMGIGASAYGVTGIPGYLTIEQPVQYTIVIGTAAAIAFVITWVLFKEDAKDETKDTKSTEAKDEKNAAEETKNPAAGSLTAASAEHKASFPQEVIIRCEAGELVAPVKGKVIPQTEIPDATFSQGILGAGVGIQPDDETVYAPCDGEISSVAESKHAIGISGPNGMEILIHVGVDTVAMQGNGFTPLVNDGDKITQGQPLLRFSKKMIADAGHPDVVVVLLTNSDDYNDVHI